MAYVNKPNKHKWHKYSSHYTTKGDENDVNLGKRKFYTMLLEKGIPYMYASNYDVIDDSPIIKSHAPQGPGDEAVSGEPNASPTKTRHRKKVLIIGAGIAGLAAAYELKRAGHKVVLVESTQRAGGRIKTLSFDFDNHEYKAEAGAMRIPLENQHYLITGYIDKFGIEMVPFYNKDKEGNCFYKVLGYETIKTSDFSSNASAEARVRAKTMCDKLWPGWDSVLKDRNIHLNDIIEYYSKTMEEVSNDAPTKPKPGESVEDYNKRWQEWMEYWSKYSLMDFLRSSDVFKDHTSSVYRPWPKEAIHALNCLNYNPSMHASVATIITDEKWWTSEMLTIKDGMESLPQAFLKDSLEDNIRYGLTVTKVEWKRDVKKPVRISGRRTRTGTDFELKGHAVIITVPLNVIRQIEFVPSLPQHVTDAVCGINQWASTKIFLGFREKFWEQTKFPVTNGGITKTNLPICQIVYPRQNEKQKRGVLLVYNWAKESQLFASMTEDQAIREALEQVQLVYADQFPNPEDVSKVSDLFEVGAVQAWSTDFSSQGAFVHFMPHSYMDNLRTLLELGDESEVGIRPVYLAGDALSFANGWIQGALESGLRAAWQFYEYNEDNPADKTSA